jgi:hypothetical protein
MGHIWVTIGQIHSNSSFLDNGMIILNPALALKRELQMYTITENIGIYSVSKRIVALIEQKQTHTKNTPNCNFIVGVRYPANMAKQPSFRCEANLQGDASSEDVLLITMAPI